MDEFPHIKVKALVPVFFGDRSYSPGEEFLLGENLAVEEELAGRVSFAQGLLSVRGLNYRFALPKPRVPGAHAIVY